jgi:putative ATPase
VRLQSDLPIDAPEPRFRPLADRMRPRSLAEFTGQSHLLAAGRPLHRLLTDGVAHSMVLWGPPGSGKTTLARLAAGSCKAHFIALSAVAAGVKDIREAVGQARASRRSGGPPTILFLDEVHRFNKAQQDTFLPYVEDGTLVFIGATTENPSFELNSALLSRLRVFVLHPLSAEAIGAIITRALRQLTAENPRLPALAPEALELLVRHADGDARRALNATEALARHLLRAPQHGAPVAAEEAATILERRLAQYDKSGEQHYNLISALHKAVRGSDPDAALYWFARMVEGGEDLLYIARRVVRMAIEDIGLADPRGLSISLAAKDAYDFLGSPEGDLAIAEAIVYLATAPKSNGVYAAWGEAQQAARDHPAAPVPLHIRNAPTRLMKEIGYSQGYRYDHAEGGHAAGQRYLPDVLREARWYEPGNAGYEKTLAERIAWWRKRRNERDTT